MWNKILIDFTLVTWISVAYVAGQLHYAQSAGFVILYWIFFFLWFGANFEYKENKKNQEPKQ